MAVRIGTIFRILLLLGSLIHLANGARPLFDPPDWTTVLPEVNTTAGAPPTFISPIWSDVFPEVNTTAGTNITRFTATDGDGDNISYSLQSNAHPWFRINSSTGDLIVNKTLDREAMGSGDGSFRFEVYASDGSSPQGSLRAFLTIIDINDNAPAFQNTPLTKSCSEDTPVGFPVVTVTATDADATTNAIITFVIVSGNEGEAFSIDKVTGDITISKPLDYENGPRVYTLNISAMNNHTDLMLQSFGVVTINVTDVDDLPANFSQKLYEAHIDKNSPLGSFITQVHAEDMDSLNAPVEYSIYPDSDPDGLFAINKTSGAVTVDGNLKNGVYSLIVNAKSTTQPPAFTLVKVTVGPLPNLTYAVTVLEGEANVQVMDLQPAKSHFNASGGTFTFFGSSGSMFSIDGAKLKVGSTPLDRETAAQHVLDISLTEGGTVKGFVKVTVNVLDINDDRPSFQSPSFNVSVNEIERLGTVILTVFATDGDAGANGTLTYSISAGNEEGFFSINNKTGAISVAKQLDRETRDQYTLTVMAQDGGEPPLNSTTAVAIQVGDANDNPPVIQDAVIQVSLSETAAIDTPVATVIASDKDIGANGRLMYSIESGAHGHFQIKDSSSGAISVAGVLSYKQWHNYTVVVKVTDGGSLALESRAIVLIDVTSTTENRNGPVFASVQYIGGVYKDTSFDFPVLTVTATDSDTGVNGVVEYRIREDTDLFYVEPTSGTIRTADVFADKDEGQSFSFSVQASDKGTPPKETKENAQITMFLLRGSNSLVLTSNMSKDDILLRRPEFLEDIKELNGGGHVIIKSIRPREGNASIITINGIKNLQEMSYNQLFDAFKASEGSPKYVKWQLTGQGEPPVTSARTADEEELSPVVIALIFLSVLVGVAGIAMILILCKKRRDERLPRKHSRVTFNDKPLYIDPVSSSGGGRADPAQEAQEVIVHMDEETSSNGSNDTHVPVDPTVLNYINNAYANSNNESDTDSETYINPDTGEITHFATFFPPPPPNVPPPPIPESDEESNGDLGTENTYMPSDQFDVDYEVFSPAPIGNRAVSPTHSTADSTAQLVDPTTFRETILHDQYFAFNGRLPSNQNKTTEL
ncbi:predicted protein [Nematostella vectensis]|uniref:Cadherin domain-containing protein n=1 Tax=Nematostella vectensis TaxID=45351 RepID=A7S5N9_NEMVE|nr:predicted protein [Nematostella vectensis]|eukprot:XP_001633107.1 predicted protein [Nematostella vectensis]